jgi:hypothetical protein
MKNLFEIDGFYGASKNEAVIFVYEKSNGSKWYCVEDSCNVNLTYDEIEEGCDIEPLKDIDTMTSTKPLNNLDEFYDFIMN